MSENSNRNLSDINEDSLDNDEIPPDTDLKYQYLKDEENGISQNNDINDINEENVLNTVNQKNIIKYL